MFVDSSTVRTKSGKSYTRHLLRESFREDGKVKHRTIANLSSYAPHEVGAVRLALSHKNQLADLGNVQEDVTLGEGPSVGAVWTVFQVAKRLGIVDTCGSSRAGKLALWQVIARVIDQGSRLSATRLAAEHAACDILQVDGFNEDDLYKNLDWLAEQQPKIEHRLVRHRDGEPPQLFLYDVTSSYLEGEHNELSNFGYNRDGKAGKRQIVIGLLCDENGRPLSVEVFAGNTADPATLSSQVHKVAERFGGGPVTFVGDRGMIKSPQIEELGKHGFHYITAITKAQIESLMTRGVIQHHLFESEPVEVEDHNGQRYILRRNPMRAEEVAASRRDKRQSLETFVRKQNAYLAEHPRAHSEVAVRKVREKIKQLRLDHWVSASISDRVISIHEDHEALVDESKLDGCYAITTDLSRSSAGKEVVHDRYKDLTSVEQAFRCQKSEHLEVRPVHVQKEPRTRGHVFVVMLGYLVVSELKRCWRDLDVTVQGGLDQLKKLCSTKILVKGEPAAQKIPEPSELSRQLLEAAGVKLPEALADRGATVATKKELPKRRSNR